MPPEQEFRRMNNTPLRPSFRKELALRYGLEFVVIVLGVFISFHVQELQDESADRVMKNEALEQLVRVMQDDLEQIESFVALQSESLRHANAFLDKGSSWVGQEDSAMVCLSHVGRALRSFFPQEGVFNQIVSSDLVELIENHELKSGLFRLYNEDLRRHAVHALEYDQFFLPFNRRLTKEFLLDDTWGKGPQDVWVLTYEGNDAYLGGNALRADVIEARACIRNYIKELQFLQGEFQGLRDLCLAEVH